MDSPVAHLTLAVGLALPLVFGSAACCQQYHCVSRASLVVVATDADSGAPVASVRIIVDAEDGGTIQITNLDGGIPDPWPAPSNEGHSYETGKLHVTVAAEGYVTTTFDVQIDKDVCGRPVGQRRDVAMQRLGAAQTALVTEGDGPKQCGQE